VTLKINLVYYETKCEMTLLQLINSVELKDELTGTLFKKRDSVTIGTKLQTQSSAQDQTPAVEPT